MVYMYVWYNDVHLHDNRYTCETDCSASESRMYSVEFTYNRQQLCCFSMTALYHFEWEDV